MHDKRPEQYIPCPPEQLRNGGTGARRALCAPRRGYCLGEEPSSLYAFPCREGIGQDPTAPRTPSGEVPGPAHATHSNSFDFHAGSYSNSYGTSSSSALRSSDSNKSRPKPLEDLQERIRARLDPRNSDPALQTKVCLSADTSPLFRASGGHCSGIGGPLMEVECKLRLEY